MSNVLWISTPSPAIQGTFDTCPDLRRVAAHVRYARKVAGGWLTNMDPTRAPCMTWVMPSEVSEWWRG